MDDTIEEQENGEPPRKKPKTPTSEFQRPPREIGLMRNNPRVELASFVGSSSGIYFIRSVQNGIKGQTGASNATRNTPGSDFVPGEDDNLPATDSSSTSFLWRQAAEVTDRTTDHPQYTFDDLLEWSQSYFENWHPAYPHLHAPTIIEYMERVAKEDILDESSPSFDLVILRSIMSISLADRRQAILPSSKPVPAELVFESYSSATDSIQRVLTEPTSIHSLQATISVQLFLVSMLRYNAASRLEGLVVRMAFQLGLHRCPTRYPAFSHEQAQLRKRVFWSLYALDRYICHALGLPLGIQDDDLDICLPSKERHSAKRPHSVPDDRLYLLEILAKHAEIRGMIIELRNKSLAFAQRKLDQAVIITAKSTKWWNEVEEFLEAGENDSNSLSQSHKITLMVLKHENVIALNRPILAVSKKSSGYSAALQDCIGASRSIINILHKALSSQSDSARVPLLWHSYTWAIWMSAYIIFYASNEGEVRRDISMKLADRCIDILEHLSLRGNVWPVACVEAIRELRTQMENRPVAGPQRQPATSVGNNVVMVSQSSVDQSNEKVAAVRPSHQTDASSNGLAGSGQQAASGSNSTENPSGPSSHSNAGSNGDLNNATGVNYLQNTPSVGYLSSYGQTGIPGLAGAATNSQTPGQSWAMPDPMFGTFNMPAFPNTNPETADPFYGFDIPFWMGQDEYSTLSGQWT